MMSDRRIPKFESKKALLREQPQPLSPLKQHLH